MNRRAFLTATGALILTANLPTGGTVSANEPILAALPPDLIPAHPSKPLGEPFRCPECGGTEWLAHYKLCATQEVTLHQDEDGEPQIGDYNGNEEIVGDPGPDEAYECANPDCGYVMDERGQETTL